MLSDCENGEKFGKNPTISYLLIAVVIKYSLLKMAAKKGRAGNGSGPKAAVYPYSYVHNTLKTSLNVVIGGQKH